MLSATLGCTFAHDAEGPEKEGLVVEVTADFTASSLSTAPVSGFYNTIELKGTTHD